jgi:hypothetical protein
MNAPKYCGDLRNLNRPECMYIADVSGGWARTREFGHGQAKAICRLYL